MLNVIFNTALMYCVVIIVMRLTGKRQIGELSIGELVVTVLISDLASLPMQNPDIPASHAIVAIVLLVGMEMLLSLLSMHSVRLRKVIGGTPTVLIQNGKIDQQAMKKVRFTVDDLMEDLRQGGALTPDEVEIAVLETNGKLSVFLKSALQPPSSATLGVPVSAEALPYTVVSDGRLLSENIRKLGATEPEITALIRKNGFLSHREIFYMSLTTARALVLIPKDKPKK